MRFAGERSEAQKERDRTETEDVQAAARAIIRRLRATLDQAEREIMEDLERG